MTRVHSQCLILDGPHTVQSQGLVLGGHTCPITELHPRLSNTVWRTAGDENDDQSDDEGCDVDGDEGEDDGGDVFLQDTTCVSLRMDRREEGRATL